MDSAAVTKQSPPPQTVIMQMVMGAWITKTVSETTRLGVPDALKKYGPLDVAQLVATAGIVAVPSALERLLRACASLGVLSEDAEGKFGSTELSEVLTSDAPGSVKKLVEAIGGPWYRGWTEFAEAIRTGQPQAREVFGMEWWDYLNANPKELEDFGEAMKSNSETSLRGVLKYCDFSSAATLADVGGGFGHLALALLERYPHPAGHRCRCSRSDRHHPHALAHKRPYYF